MIFILGEAWGQEEERVGLPFVGASGRFLKSALSRVGIRYEDCQVSNVFNLRPKPTNDVKNLCGPKSEGILGMPALYPGKYVRAEYASEITRLHKELQAAKPTLILALGSTATWALGLGNSIKRIRGAAVLSKFGKVFPTVHPAAIFRDWTLRPIFFSDLAKAVREAQFPEIRRPEREIWVEPTLQDIATFYELHIKPARRLSVDIETSGKYITCIGFAPSINLALVVPFILADGKPYWSSEADERAAWEWVRRACQHPNIIGQNFLYDAHRLWRTYGIPTPGFSDDTMLLHHSLYMELEKGLGFLGSVYTNEARWKFMRDVETIKKGDE